MSTVGRAPSEYVTAPNGVTARSDSFERDPDGGGRVVLGDGLVDGPGRQRVSEIQRTRLLAAMTEVCAELGAGNVTVGHVVRCAGVSRRTFYELFDDREDCFLAALDDAIDSASRYVLDTYDPHAKWEVRVRAALTALLGFLDAERGAGSLLIVGSLGAGAGALERRRRVLARLIAVVEEGRGESSVGKDRPPLTAEGVVGGVLSVLQARLLERDCPPLVGLAGQLMSMIVLPYLGPAAARREISRHTAGAPVRALKAPANPLKDLQMRLTYRTVRVLLAVAAHPGASNRVIGEASGMRDQGQASKLLGRLERLGLVENGADKSVQGAANAWMLTVLGEEVNGVLATQGNRS